MTATNSGGSTSVSVSITVNDVAPSALTYSLNPAVYTKGSAISSNSPSASGGSVLSYSVTPTLPAGLSLSAGTGIITGTPTAITGIASYIVTATNSGGSTTVSVSITVNDIAPSGLSYSTNPATYTKGSAITANSPMISGGPVTSYSVSPGLPAGLSLNTSSGVITGSPTAVTAMGSYTVTASNTGGSATVSIPITVNDVIPSSLTYSTNPAVYTKGTAITANSPSISGGTVTGYSVSPTLPAGLSLSTSTGIISGTPTAITAIANYTVTATNSGGSTTVSVSITVNDVAPSTFTYSPASTTATKGTAITAMNPSISGGTVTAYTSGTLPAGLSLNSSTGVISGTPTAVQVATPYTITATNSGGSTTATVNITVNDVAPSAVTYTLSTATYTKGSAITSNSPSTSGSPITGYTISPALPAGLTLGATSGIISGTPTALAPSAAYTVTASNSGGSVTATLSITVIDVAPSTLTYSSNPATYAKSTAITANNPSNTGGAVVSYAVSPTLPAGLSLSTSTGVISGTPTAITSTVSYTVTATNTGGSTTASVSITVTDAAPTSLTYFVNPVTYTNGYAITNNTASNSGGVITTYTVSPALPAGLTLSPAAGTIYGTPTAVAATATYTVTGTNTGGTATASVSITVANPTIAVSANNNQTAAARASLPSAFTAIVKDANNTVINAQLVDWAVVTGGGTLSSAANSTNTSGLSSSTLTLGKKIGSNTVTATIDGTTVSVTFTATATTTNFTNTWSFASGAPYTYDSNKIDFSNGYAELTPVNQIDNSNTGSTSFNAGTNTGTAWDSNGNTFLRLAHTADGANASDIELAQTWTPQWTSLIGYWKFNETAAASGPSGTDFIDSSGAGNHMTAGGTITYGAPGKLNKATTFGGTNSVAIGGPSSAIVSSANHAFTISVWINASSFGASGTIPNRIIDSYNGTTTSNFALGVEASTGNKVAFYNLSDNSYTTWPTQLLASTWYHVALVYNGTCIQPYLNGSPDGACISKSITAGSSDKFTVGNFATYGYAFAGQIDDLAIWSTNLNSAAIAHLFNHESSKYAGTFTSRVMDGLNSTSWTTLAPVTTLPFNKQLPDTATTPSPTPVSETSTSYSAQTSNLMGTGSTTAGGIVGLWHLDEPAGTTSIRDTSGNGYTGTASSGVTLGAAGKLGTAASLPGTTSYIQTTLPVSSLVNGYTLSGWYRASLGTSNTGTTNGWNWIAAAQFFPGSARYFQCGRKSSTTNVRFDSDTYSTAAALDTTTANITDGNWHHVICMWDRVNSMKYIYVDGVQAASVSAPLGVTTTTYGNLVIGAHGTGASPTVSYNEYTNGALDEIAVWSRALSAAEVLEVYRRGANRLKYQIQTCATASACATSPNWQGPDGTNQTFFSELNNNLIPKDGADSASGDSVLASLLNLSFANYSTTGLTVTNREFFQYRTVMESDDTSTACNYGSGGTWCSPELKSVTIGPNHYDTSNPTVVNIVNTTYTGTTFATLATLVDTLGTGGCNNGSVADASTLDSTRYQLSADGTNWYWYDVTNSIWSPAGTTISTATAGSALTGTVLNLFPQAGTVYFKTFLQSSGTSACTLSSLLMTGTH